MDNKKIEKMNTLKNIIVKHSHKIDLIIGSLLLAYGIYGYYNEIEYSILFVCMGIFSLILAIVKPVKLFDNYMNKKIIKKFDK